MADLREQLLPCPFCGHDDSLIVEHVEGTIIHPAYYVRCDYCGAQGASRDRNRHVEAWNERALAAQPATVPEGWRVQQNTDGSIGLFAPPPKDGESRRTSHAFYPGARGDAEELVYKLLRAMLAAAPSPAVVKESSTTAQPEAQARADDALLSAMLAAEQENAACSRCRGRGYVVDADIDDDGRSIGTMDPCPDCAASSKPKPAEGEWIAADDVNRIVRELDVALNGAERAAPQASLCDIVGQVQDINRRLGSPLLAVAKRPAEGGAVPSAKAWVAENRVAVSLEWMAGWDACRVEYPRSASAGSGEAVATLVGYDPWSRPAVEWHRRDIEPGTKFYAGAPPAAGQGEVPLSRREVEEAFEKAGAFRRKETLWTITTREAHEAVRSILRRRLAGGERA